MRKRKRRISLPKKTIPAIFYTAMIAMAILIIPILGKLSYPAIAATAGLTLPEGGKQLLLKEMFGSAATPSPILGENADDLPAIMTPGTQSQNPEQSSTVISNITDVQLADPPDIPDEQKRNISEQVIGKSGLNSGNVWIKNSTGKTIDIPTLLNARPDIYIEKNDQPQVLIYHTHTTESYLNYDTGWYDSKGTSRSGDTSLNMIAVGNQIVNQLEAAGIKTIHDTNVYDSPAYTGAYSRSAKTIQDYLNQYPSIQVVLDIHRDSMTQDDGTKIKPTVEINGKKAAQIMIISGCESEKSLPNPDWEYNLKFAVRLQNQLETDYPGITRPINFMIAQYNQQYSHGGLLIEVGTDANTIAESVYTGQLFGQSLAKVLDGLQGE